MTLIHKILVFIGFLIIVSLTVFVLIPYLITQQLWYTNYGEKTAIIADTFGGIIGTIVGFMGVILTFLAFYIQFKANQVQINALNEQKKSSQQQEKQILIQQFENIFFELLKVHRENVTELEYRNHKGRDVFIKIVNEFYELLKQLETAKIIKNNNLGEQDIANIAYFILFYGVDETIEDVLFTKFIQKYFSINASLKGFIKKIRKTPNPYIEKDKYYFNGNQSRLGHYFRHLLRTIRFVHRNNILSTDQKKEYVRILRSQFTDHEQILLFFYSISDLGLKWELGDNKKENIISKYNLVKNIPLDSVYGFKVDHYYPNIRTEHNYDS